MIEVRLVIPNVIHVFKARVLIEFSYNLSLLAKMDCEFGLRFWVFVGLFCVRAFPSLPRTAIWSAVRPRDMPAIFL